MKLLNKVAVISAAASGMGRAGAILFANEGAKVNILDIDEEKGEEVVQTIQERGGEAKFYKLDLSDVQALKAVLEDIHQQYGRIDILWNHFGVPGPKGLEEVSEEDFDKAMSLNVKNGFFGTQYVVPIMKKIGRGSIIFTASTSGLVASPLSPVYSAGKGAVVNLVRALAVRLAPDKIRVNSICPVLTETPMMLDFLKRTEEDNIEDNKNTFLSSIPFNRLAVPEDIANAALFLASDASEFISGVNLPVDGAYTAK